MNNQRLVQTYLARARELEDSAQRVEKFSPAMQMSQRRRGAATSARPRLPGGAPTRRISEWS